MSNAPSILNESPSTQYHLWFKLKSKEKSSHKAFLKCFQTCAQILFLRYQPETLLAKRRKAMSPLHTPTARKISEGPRWGLEVLWVAWEPPGPWLHEISAMASVHSWTSPRRALQTVYGGSVASRPLWPPWKPSPRQRHYLLCLIA